MDPNQQPPIEPSANQPVPSEQPQSSQTTDDLAAVATQQSIPLKSKKPLIFAIVGGLAALSGLIYGIIWWQEQQQTTQDKQLVSSLVGDFFEAARLHQDDRLNSLLTSDKDDNAKKTLRSLSNQIGRECKSAAEDVVVTPGKIRTASLSTSCLPKQTWSFGLVKSSTDGWLIDSVEGSNLVPTIEQALSVDPYINISIYADENKPKPGSCLVPDDAALFNGTSLPRDPFLYFHDDRILFEADSLKYFPAEKATDQFDAFERFYRLTAQRRYHFVITPESHASDNKAPVLKLAGERAEAVQESLLKRGIPRSRITLQNPVDAERTTSEQSRGVKLNIQASRTCDP